MRYDVGMEHIAGRIAEIARNIEIVDADPVTRHGFTQVPNFILTNAALSVGAKLAYAMLLKYAWDDNGCYPGQVTLAADMGSGESSVRRYLDELESLRVPGNRAARARKDQLLSPSSHGKGEAGRKGWQVLTGQNGRSRPAIVADQERPILAGHSI